MVVVEDISELAELLRKSGKRHYVYILRNPQNRQGTGTPFYVGIGKGPRVFAHEEEARNPASNNLKVQTIRNIWQNGSKIVREIEGFYEEEPWEREEQLINSLGRVQDGTGTLTNAQVYAPSRKVAGVEVRKYARVSVDDPDTVPATFKLTDRLLMAGPIRPKSSTKRIRQNLRGCGS